MDPKIGVRFDGSQGLAFVAGEDRTISVAIYDQNVGQPINLTGGAVFVNFPRSGGGTVKRTSAALPIAASAVTTGSPGAIVLNDHGLVTNDAVTFAVVSGGLPAPLAGATTYLVSVIDNNTFSVTDNTGAAINLTTAGTGTFTVSNGSDISLTTPTAGLVTLTLRYTVTNAIEAGLGQTFEVGYTIGGKTRIQCLPGLLDVTAQPDP